MDKINVIEQKTALLYGDEIIAVRADDGHVYVSLRQMCNALEIKRNGQVRRINNHAILSQGYKGGHVLLPPSADGRGGGKLIPRSKFDTAMAFLTEWHQTLVGNAPF